jgi:hypothetical protein
MLQILKLIHRKKMPRGRMKLHSTPERLTSREMSLAVIYQEVTVGLRLLAWNSVRDSWWTKWLWDEFLRQYFGLPLL